MPEIVEVILVNGASTDGTPDVARKLLPSICIVEQDGRGKGNALRCGASAAKGDYLMVVDADDSHRPEEIPVYIDMARQGYEMIKGCRYLHGGGTEDETLGRGIMVRLADIVANFCGAPSSPTWRTVCS
jgi:glycosyltransferase involved in cell wall biosynthesis